MLLFPALAGAQALPYVAADFDAISLGKAGANLTETGTISNGGLNNAAAMPFSELPYEATVGYALWQPSNSAANVINAGFAYNIKQKFALAFSANMGLNKPYDVVDASGTAKGTYTPKDMHLAFGLAYRFLPYLSLGVNVGYANSSLAADYSYGAVTADVFVMTKVKDFKATVGVANLGSNVTSASGVKFSLVLCTSTCHSAGLNLTAFADEFAKLSNVFIIDCFNFICTELTNLFLRFSVSVEFFFVFFNF